MMKLLADHVLAMAMVVTAGVPGQWRLGVRTLLALMLSTYGGYLSRAVKAACHPLGDPIIWRWTYGKG